MSLDGRWALVTGASRGIGAACARRLGADGARLILAARSADDLAAVAAEIDSPVQTVVCDLAAAGEAERLADEALAISGGIDILVNNAGVLRNRGVHRLARDEIEQTFAINVVAAMVLTARLVVPMKAKGVGSIVSISSIHGTVGVPYSALYAATKGALEAFTRSVAAEVGRSGVRINLVAPGAIRTAMWEEIEAAGVDASGVINQIALRTWGQPDDVADAVAFLVSAQSAYVTGHTLFVDGGLGRLVNLLPT